jgi:response regulator RpfG family c-di-GMP phosphodiesterase
MSILIVDDDPTSLLLLAAVARQASALPVVTLTDPLTALAWCAQHSPTLLLVDYRMEHLDGIEFIGRFRAIAAMAQVPIIMITSENERSVRQQALAAGATDFLSKPIDTVELRLRLRNLLALSEAQDRLAERELALVRRLTQVAACRAPAGAAHLQRLARYAVVIAQGLNLPPAFQQQLLAAAPLLDLGMLATPEASMRKAARLTAEETAAMRGHAARGAALLADSDSPLLQLAAQIAGGHHERFDGSGYPGALAGCAIALSARIVAVADVFAALTSERPYRPAWSAERARTHLQHFRGTLFCPLCVQAFVDGWEQIAAIHAGAPAPQA